MGRKGLVLSVLAEGEPTLCGCSAGLPPQLWQGEPVIVLNPTEQRLEVGKPLQLQCAAMGVPAPSYQWYRNGNPLEHHKKKKLWVMSWLVQKLRLLRWVVGEAHCWMVGVGELRSCGETPEKQCHGHAGDGGAQSCSRARSCLLWLGRA